MPNKIGHTLASELLQQDNRPLIVVHTGVLDPRFIIDWTADNTAKYFSVDGGTTQIATFSNGAKFGDGFEAHHWKNNLGLGIMNPTVHAGELLTISDTDLRAFDVLGYDLQLSGDFNASGTVDAADYVVWRKVDGTSAGYQLWSNNFGQPGNGAGANSNATIPEPTNLVLIILTGIGWCIRRRQSHRN